MSRITRPIDVCSRGEVEGLSGLLRAAAQGMPGLVPPPTRKWCRIAGQRAFSLGRLEPPRSRRDLSHKCLHIPDEWELSVGDRWLTD